MFGEAIYNHFIIGKLHPNIKSQENKTINVQSCKTTPESLNHTESKSELQHIIVSGNVSKEENVQLDTDMTTEIYCTAC